MHVDWRSPNDVSHRNVSEPSFISPMEQKFAHSPPLGSTLGLPTQEENNMQAYTDLVNKAYSPANQKLLLEKAKQSLDSTELKLLILMLQMRGQYSSNGEPMIGRGT